MSDPIKWQCEWDVQRYDEDAVSWLTERLGRTPQGADFEAAGIDPYSESHIPGNLLTTAGLDRITKLIIGSAGQAATNTAARIGVGNGVTAEAVGNTDLAAAAGSTNRWFQIMDASKPTQANGVMTFVSTFASADGNFTWAEFGVDIGTPTVTSGNTVNAVLLNRKLSAQGTKTSGQSWTATATVTLS